MIASNNPKLYRAYRIKEKLRLLVKIKDLGEATKELESGLWWASHSRIPGIIELNKKIQRHMLDMVYLVCSDLVIPLPNRKTKEAKSA